MAERVFVIDRLFPSGDIRIKLEVDGEVLAVRRFVYTPAKQAMRKMREEFGLKHKKIICCWL